MGWLSGKRENETLVVLDFDAAGLARQMSPLVRHRLVIAASAIS
jgi:hypothetical protein